MNDPRVFGPIQPQAQEESKTVQEPVDWKAIAPRWLLLITVGALLVLVGSLSTALFAEKSERQVRMEDALKDTPTKYQARLSERVAVLETQTERLNKALGDQTVETRALSAVTNELTLQIKILNIELRNQKGVR